MKQKIFSSKGLLRNTLIRSSWLGLLNGILFFFALPVAMLFTLQNISSAAERAAGALEALSPGQGGCGVWCLLAMVMGGVTAWAMCMYLHDRRQVVFYHSQPVSRGGLYLTRLLAGLLWFVLGLLANLLLTAVVTAAFGAAVPWGALAGLAGILLLCFFFLFSVTACCAPLAGSALSHLEVTVFALFAPVGLAGCVFVLFGRFFSTFVSGPWDALLLRLSGPVWLLNLLYTGAPLWWLAVYAGVSAGLLALGLLLVKRYPSEAAGATLPYPFTRTVIRLPVIFMGAVYMGAFFHNLGGGLFLEGLGCLLGGVLAHMYCQGRFFRDFRAVFRGWISLAAVLAAAAAVMVCMGLDIFGYDRWLPANDRVSETGVTLWAEGFEESDPKSLVSRGDEWITLSRELAESAVAAQGDGTLDNTHSLEIYWKLENGATVLRRYSLPDTTENLEKLCRLQNSPAYQGVYSADSLAALLPEASYFSLRVDGPVYAEMDRESYDRETVAGMLAALSADYREVGISPAAGVKAEVYVELQAAGDSWQSACFPVYAGWSRTLTLLEEAGLLAPADREDAARFSGLSIHTPEGTVLTLTEPEALLPVLDCLLRTGYCTDTGNTALFCRCELLYTRTEIDYSVDEKDASVILPDTVSGGVAYISTGDYRRLFEK